MISQHAARLLFRKTRGARNQDKDIITTFTPSLVYGKAQAQPQLNLFKLRKSRSIAAFLIKQISITY